MTEDLPRLRPAIVDCPKCQFVNARENKMCSKCAYPLSQEALDEIKAEENKKIQSLQEQLRLAKEESDQKFERILSLISQNPKLANIKPEALARLQVKEQAPGD